MRGKIWEIGGIQVKHRGDRVAIPVPEILHTLMYAC
jgi:hypothetical protein